MSSHGTILIVEDEVEISEILRDYLIRENYDVSLIHTGDGVVEQVRKSPPDLILLDLMLPTIDGLSICRAVRQFSNLAVIMISAKVDEIDRLIGLDIGADDYICKPVKPKEVVARVKAVLRRTQPATTQTLHSPLRLDKTQHQAYWDGQSIDLTPVEFRLLELLSQNSQRIYSRSILMDLIYEDGRFVGARTIDSHVAHLRRKLAVASNIENPVRSVYGMGYKLEIDSPDNS